MFRELSRVCFDFECILKSFWAFVQQNMFNGFETIVNKMENRNSNKLRYEAPEMKTTEFNVEQGYAVSGQRGSSTITMQGGGL